MAAWRWSAAVSALLVAQGVWAQAAPKARVDPLHDAQSEEIVVTAPFERSRAGLQQRTLVLGDVARRHGAFSSRPRYSRATTIRCTWLVPS